MRSRVALAALMALSLFARRARADGADSWVSRDKALHFDASLGIAAAGYAVSAGWLVDARWKALAMGGGLAIAAGAGKELVDATGIFHGDPSWKDFTWDVLGAIAGLAVAYGADLLIGGIDGAHPALSGPRGPREPPGGGAATGLTVRF